MADTQTALHTTNQSVTAANIRTPDRDTEIEIAAVFQVVELFITMTEI